MSVFSKGLLACSVGPLKLSLRIRTGPNFKPGELTNPEISREGHIPPPIPTIEVSTGGRPYEGLRLSRHPNRVSNDRNFEQNCSGQPFWNNQ